MKTPSLVIVSAVRTPFSRAGTDLAHLDAVELGRHAVAALLTRTGIDPMLVDETIIGCVGQPPEAMNIARVIALRAGLPESKPALTVHRHCASSLEALTRAHAKMCAGQGEVCLFDQNNLQSKCCPPGVKGNVLGICDLLVCL